MEKIPCREVFKGFAEFVVCGWKKNRMSRIGYWTGFSQGHG
jgi:hypothetical protein